MVNHTYAVVINISNSIHTGSWGIPYCYCTTLIGLGGIGRGL